VSARSEGHDQAGHHDAIRSRQRGEQGMIGMDGDQLLDLPVQLGNVFT